jgi:hypothetical protein
LPVLKRDTERTAAAAVVEIEVGSAIFVGDPYPGPGWWAERGGQPKVMLPSLWRELSSTGWTKDYAVGAAKALIVEFRTLNVPTLTLMCGSRRRVVWTVCTSTLALGAVSVTARVRALRGSGPSSPIYRPATQVKIVDGRTRWRPHHRRAARLTVLLLESGTTASAGE